MLHSSLLMFSFFLVFSILWVLSCNSWFYIWIGLEINLLSFIPLILHKKSKYSTEAAIKYFLIQATSSVLILTAFLLTSRFGNMENLLISALMIKLGSAPFHQWVLSLTEGMSWLTLMFFFILQKINPFFIMSYISSNKYILYYFILCSALVGSIGGLNQTSLRKIMVYSSVAHASWLLSTLLLPLMYSITYYLLYAILMYMTLYLFKQFELNDLNFMKKSNNILVLSALNFLSLGGLPPLLGFLPKLMILNKLIFLQEYMLVFIILLATFLSLFFYMRFFISAFLTQSPKTLFKFKNKYSIFYITFNFSLIFTYPLLI